MFNCAIFFLPNRFTCSVDILCASLLSSKSCKLPCHLVTHKTACGFLLTYIFCCFLCTKINTRPISSALFYKVFYTHVSRSCMTPFYVKNLRVCYWFFPRLTAIGDCDLMGLPLGVHYGKKAALWGRTDDVESKLTKFYLLFCDYYDYTIFFRYNHEHYIYRIHM